MKNVELKKKFRNKYMIQVVAGAVTIAMLGQSAGMAYTVNAEKADETTKQSHKKDSADEKDIKNALENVISASKEAEDAGKEETVYVVAGADGAANNVIVSEWFKNEDGK